MSGPACGRTGAGEDVLRSFLAIEPPGPVLDALVASRRTIEGRLPAARWVPKKNQHLTLRFLGDVHRSRLGKLAERVRALLEGVGPVVLALDGGGFFPGPSRPRVAWVGGRADGIEPILEAVDLACRDLDFEARDKPWALHLTQARIRRHWDRNHRETYLQWADGLDLQPVERRRLLVVTSELRPEGAVYTEFERIPFA